MDRVRKSLVALFLALLVVALSTSSVDAEPASDGPLPQTPLLRPSAAQLTPAAVNNAFESLTPARLLDTRANSATIDGQFAGVGALGPGTTLDLTALGRGNVPALGVGAVAVNVTAVAPSGNGFLTVWPTGALRPNASNLNFVAGDVVPNMVVVRVGANGRISIYNEAGSTDLLVDVVGWFADNAGLQPLVPARLLDTRSGGATIDGLGAGGGALGPDATTDVLVVNRGGVPPTGAATVVLNITVTAPTSNGFVTAWPSTAGRPNASNLNFVPDQTVANMVISKLGPDGRVNLYNSSGATQIIVDVMGWFAADSELTSLQPARLLDTRPGSATTDGLYSGSGTLDSNTTRSLPVLGRGGVPASGVGAVAVNVTVTAPTAASFLTVWPSGITRPNASSLNYSEGKSVANMVLARIGPDGAVAFYNSSGSTHVIVDVVGWMPPNQPLALGNYNLVPGVIGQPYSQLLGVNGSQGPYVVLPAGVSPGVTLSGGTTVVGTPSRVGTTSTQFLLTDRFGRLGLATVPHHIFPASSGYVAVAPTTLLDTLTESQPMAPQATRAITVGGVGGVPATGVAAVLSVAARSFTGGYLNLFSNGSPTPNTAQVLLAPNRRDTDFAVVPIGIGGQVNVFVSTTTDVRVDVVGYVPLGGSYNAASPVRVLDTRLTAPLAAGAQLDVVLAGAGGLPMGTTDVLAVVTIVETNPIGGLTIWDKGGTAPTSPSLRWDFGSTSQFVVMHIGADGSATIKNSGMPTSFHVIVDIYGYFT